MSPPSLPPSQLPAACLCGRLLPTVHAIPGLIPPGTGAGIVHSVGGSDYGHVRVGAFMGLRIASQLAAEDLKRGGGGNGSDEAAPIGERCHVPWSPVRKICCPSF